MIILHASASDGRLVFWGETSLEPAGKPAKKAKRRNGEFRLGPSRFALDADRLVEIVAGEAGSRVSKDQKQQWTAWLPSSERGALPSSPLLVDEPEEPGEVTLGPWTTPTLALTSEQAIALLLAAIGRTTCAPGVVIGKTLAYWSSVLRFAGASWPGNNICPVWTFFTMEVASSPGGSRCSSARIGLRPSGWRDRCRMPAAHFARMRQNRLRQRLAPCCFPS